MNERMVDYRLSFLCVGLMIGAAAAMYLAGEEMSKDVEGVVPVQPALEGRDVPREMILIQQRAPKVMRAAGEFA